MFWFLLACSGDGGKDSANTSQPGPGTAMETGDIKPDEQGMLNSQPGWQSTEIAYATGAAFADMDRDGDLDLVVSEGNDMEPGFLRIYFNHQGELEQQASWSSTNAFYYGHLCIGDVDGDGWSDVIISRYIGNQGFSEPGGLQLFHNQQGELSLLWEVDGFYSFSSALGDMDNDGDLDLAVAVGEAYYNTPDNSRVYENDGQEEAVQLVANAIKLSRAGLKEPNKPVGCFLFSGPTGVGKTELAKQLANVLGISFQRFDMSEYQERHTASRLIGAPPGYVGFEQGGLLTDAISRNPHCVLLLDEIEKAHLDIYNLLLQVMDNATLTDNTGKKADFRNVILIMTTNAGARDASKRAVGFGSPSSMHKITAALERAFSPEFRNRLDSIIHFKSLPMDIVRLIVDKFIGQLNSQIEDREVEITLDEAAKDWLCARGYKPEFGAREMSRVIHQHIKQPLADLMLFGELQEGGLAKVTIEIEEGKKKLVIIPQKKLSIAKEAKTDKKAEETDSP